MELSIGGWRGVSLKSGIAAAWLAAMAVGAVPADDPPGFVPLGVYLSWERIESNAAARGVDRWADAGNRLDALQANHVNLLWVTNMAEADLPRLLDECGKRGIRVLPSMGSIEAKVDWRWTPESTYYDKAVPAAIAAAGGSTSLVGWVLSDEPMVEHLPRLSALQARLRDLDPARFCTTVSMWPQTPTIARESKLPVICVDLYPFFGPDDPNGPHTDSASRSFLRRHAEAMMEAIGERRAVGWVMGMCFSDIWGPRRYDERGHLIGLPGSYLHWRAPTLAEMRWQVWETFRTGAKGFVCYTLAPEPPDPKTASLPPADVEWKSVLAKTATDLGPNALTNPDGSATPQLEELGRLYARLAPQADLLRDWQRLREPLIEALAGATAQAFVLPASGALYAVVVNDDLQQEQTITVRFGERVTGVHDVLAAQPVAGTQDFAGGSSTLRLRLAAGDGTILAIDRTPAAP
jgi:hypothetical protein